jgi:hypothetical protein
MPNQPPAKHGSAPAHVELTRSSLLRSVWARIRLPSVIWLNAGPMQVNTAFGSGDTTQSGDARRLPTGIVIRPVRDAQEQARYQGVRPETHDPPKGMRSHDGMPAEILVSGARRICRRSPTTCRHGRSAAPGHAALPARAFRRPVTHGAAWSPIRRPPHRCS